MPWYFFEKYKEEMHSKVWFVDTRGNMFGLFLRKLRWLRSLDPTLPSTMGFTPSSNLSGIWCVLHRGPYLGHGGCG